MTEAPTLEAQMRRHIEVAWAAGVLDALGSFTVVPRRSGGWSPRVRVRVRSQRWEPILHRLRDTFGGSISIPKVSRWEWQLSGASACADATRELLPYLGRQAPRANALLRLCVQITSYRAPSFDQRQLPQEELRARAELAAAIRRL